MLLHGPTSWWGEKKSIIYSDKVELNRKNLVCWPHCLRPKFFWCRKYKNVWGFNSFSCSVFLLRLSGPKCNNTPGTQSTCIIYKVVSENDLRVLVWHCAQESMCKVERLYRLYSTQTKCPSGQMSNTQRDLLGCVGSAWVCESARGGRCGISTQNHVRAVTSRAEIGLVSAVIRRRGERGKRRKLEERKRPFHQHYLPLHLHRHNNFISNSRHWMHNRAAMPLWSRLKLMEYLYAGCGTLNSLSFLNSLHTPPPPSTYLSF